jgi:hypothetical protein
MRDAQERFRSGWVVQSLVLWVGMMVLLSFAVVGAPTDALAGATGSYSQSCRSCTDNGTTLSCECSYKNKYTRTTLNYSTCEPGSVWNDKSTLRCNPRLPDGSYKQSCRNCSMSGNKLTCECSFEGKYTTTSLDDYTQCPANGIWNDKGWLLCKKGIFANYDSGHNYCGPKKYESYLTSGVAPGVSFNPACVYHDVCYGQCQKDKGGCDREFKNIMMKHCDGIKNEAARKTACRANAEAYYQAVSKGADAFKAYNCGQRSGGGGAR